MSIGPTEQIARGDGVLVGRHNVKCPPIMIVDQGPDVICDIDAVQSAVMVRVHCMQHHSSRQAICHPGLDHHSRSDTPRNGVEQDGGASLDANIER